jgi:hypothetical protein
LSSFNLGPVMSCSILEQITTSLTLSATKIVTETAEFAMKGNADFQIST